MFKLFSLVLSIILISSTSYAYKNNNSWVVQPKSYNNQNSNNNKMWNDNQNLQRQRNNFSREDDRNHVYQGGNCIGVKLRTNC
jgi:hypothetical protein